MAVIDRLPGEANIYVTRGDTLSVSYTFTDEGEPLSLSTSAIRLQLKSPLGAVIGSYTIGSGLVVSGPGSNILTWRIESDDMEDIPLQQENRYDIEITSGGDRRTYIKGTFIVQEDYTV